MTRRIAIAGAAIAAATLTLTAQTRPAGPPKFNFGPAGTIQKVAENLYVIPAGGGNTSVYVTSKGVVVVDMKTSENGQAVLDQIKTVTDKPILYVINTHVHMDHTGGNTALPEAVEVVAHTNLAEALKKDPNFQDPAAAKRGLVDKTYTDKLTLLSGDDAVDLYNFGPAHTNGDSLVVFRKARAMATGDLFPSRGQPIIDTMNGGSGVNYGEAVGKAAVAIANVDIIIPGHSANLAWQDFVDFGEFNRLFLAHARDAVKAGKTPAQAMDEFKAKVPATFKGLPARPRHDDRSGRQLRADLPGTASAVDFPPANPFGTPLSTLRSLSRNGEGERVGWAGNLPFVGQIGPLAGNRSRAWRRAR